MYFTLANPHIITYMPTCRLDRWMAGWLLELL